MATNYSFGWIKDKPDSRDIPYVPLEARATLPPSADIVLPPVYNQGNLGSCVANALCTTFDYLDKTRFKPSRLFLYYNCRKRQGTVDYDSGSTIRTGFQSMNGDGICPERLHPYIIEKFMEKPSADDYKNAKFHKAIQYRYVENNLSALKTAIVNKLPVCFGFIVYESFVDNTKWNPATDPMPIPAEGEKVLGGHAVVACGYDDTKGCFKIRNSWGTGYGDEGHFWMPYDFITSDECADFWVLERITIGTQAKD